MQKDPTGIAGGVLRVAQDDGGYIVWTQPETAFDHSYWDA